MESGAASVAAAQIMTTKSIDSVYGKPNPRDNIRAYKNATFFLSIWVTKLIFEYHWIGKKSKLERASKKKSHTRIYSGQRREKKKNIPVNWIQCVNKCNNIIICGLWVWVCIEEVLMIFFFLYDACFHYTPFCWECFFFVCPLVYFFSIAGGKLKREWARARAKIAFQNGTHRNLNGLKLIYLFSVCISHIDSAFFSPYRC